MQFVFPQQILLLYIICLYNKHIIIYIGNVVVGKFVGRGVNPVVMRAAVNCRGFVKRFMVVYFVGKSVVVGKFVGTRRYPLIQLG
jgi:hypothetical protein